MKPRFFCTNEEKSQRKKTQILLSFDLFKKALPPNEIARLNASAITAMYSGPNAVLKSDEANGPKLLAASTM